ncbi:unnamed protein product [Ambrosiozyma monospora]|uniref:Unnamed protein product n=1 Tax=Ambrosiozyma monospora TaxID=43982 RepID=A0A9W7DET4_AMBMO|nr:unnamed protein product [Ambrosiozyma monospora]
MPFQTKRPAKNEGRTTAITAMKKEDTDTIGGTENGSRAINIPIRFTFTELKGLAIPVRIPERKSFDVQIDPGSNLKEVMDVMKQFYSKASPTDCVDDSIKETHSKLVNIRDEIYKFTFSQLLQLLTAYKGLFLLKNHGKRSYITFKSKSTKRCLHFFKLLLRYDQDEGLIYLRNSDLPSCTIATTYSMVPFGEISELSKTSIPITIPEDENVKLNIDSNASMNEVARELDVFCKDRKASQQLENIHSSFHDTVSKLSTMNDEVYRFTMSQLLQFLTAYHSNSDVVYFDTVYYMRFRFDDNPVPLKNASAKFPMQYQPDTGTFYVKKMIPLENGNDKDAFDDDSSAQTRIKVFEIINGRNREFKVDDWNLSQGYTAERFLANSVPVEIPQDNTLPVQFSADLPMREIVESLREKCKNMKPPVENHRSIHRMYANLFFNKDLSYRFTPSQLIQFLSIYDCSLSLRFDHRHPQYSCILCGVRWMNNVRCPVTYPLRYDANTNVFVVRVVGTSAPHRHCHDFEYAAALVGMTPKDYGLDELELARLCSSKETLRIGENNNDIHSNNNNKSSQVETQTTTTRNQKLTTLSGNPKSYICPTCSRALSSKFYLRRHMISHTEKIDNSHVCDVCTTVFERQDLLTEHLKTHQKAQSTRTRTGTETGTRNGTITRTAGGSRSSGKSKTIDEKSFKCGVCSRVFSRNHALQRHLNTFHAGKVGNAIAKIVKGKTTGKSTRKLRGCI